MRNTKFITRIIFISIAFLLTECYSAKDFKLAEDTYRSEIVNDIMNGNRIVISDYSPKIQAKLWKYKIHSILVSNKLSKGEKSLIRKLYRDISPECFIKGSIRNTAWVEKSESIVEKLSSNFGWDDEKIQIYFGEILTVDELKDFLEKYKPAVIDMSKY